MAIDIKLAWRNLWRNPRRTTLTVLAIAFASLLLVFMLSWQFGSYETMINASVKIHTGHLHVEQRQYQAEMKIRQVMGRPHEVARILEQTPGVKHFTFRSNAFALLSSKERTYGAMVTGIDPKREAEVSTLKNIIRQGSFLEPGDPEGALVGTLLARNLKVKIGDELALLGQTRDGSIAATVLKVRGIYRSGIDEFDRSTMQVSLDNFGNTFEMRGEVHQAVAICGSLTQVSAAKKFISSRLAPIAGKRKLVVKDWQELMPGLVQGIEMDLISGVIFYILLLIVVAFSILNTFLMAIMERMHEFGVLMAVGTTPRRLARLVLTESMTITLVGIILGMILGCLVTGYFQVYGINISGMSEMMEQFGISGTLYPRLSLLSVFLGPSLVFLITIATALYPALKVLRLTPVEALYHD
ncbi:MAG: FtsX-like permease family protein [Desulfarculaceae bacterium]|jgi:ABC-type lipoprotein release transport system permease subunit